VERVLLEDTSLSPDYLLVVDERAGQPHLVALCEYRPEGGGPAETEIEIRLRDALGVRITVRLLPAGSVPRTELGKAVRVVRWAGGEPPAPGLR
jgi:phenylacetate-CoA ligase